MIIQNRLATARIPCQGDYRKVLCVCSAGLLRSPTLAWVLSQPPYEYNTRAVGVTTDFALIPMDEVHVQWADEIVFVDENVYLDALQRFGGFLGKDVIVLDLPVQYDYREPELVESIHDQYSPFK